MRCIMILQIHLKFVDRKFAVLVIYSILQVA